MVRYGIAVVAVVVVVVVVAEAGECDLNARLGWVGWVCPWVLGGRVQ